MAHSDSLIFLTNITWIFLFFLGFYLILVFFFLPTFYKKLRVRVLAYSLSKRRFLLRVSNSFGIFFFFLDFIKNFFRMFDYSFMQSNLVGLRKFANKRVSIVFFG